MPICSDHGCSSRGLSPVCRLGYSPLGQLSPSNLMAVEGSRAGTPVMTSTLPTSGLTVMICALSSAERVLGLGLAWKRLWKACMAQAVTSCRRHTDLARRHKVHSCSGASSPRSITRAAWSLQNPSTPRHPLKTATLVRHGNQQKTSKDIKTETQLSARALPNTQKALHSIPRRLKLGLNRQSACHPSLTA